MLKNNKQKSTTKKASKKLNYNSLTATQKKAIDSVIKCLMTGGYKSVITKKKSKKK